MPYIYFSVLWIFTWLSIANTPIHHQKITETANTHISFTAVSDTGTWYTQRIQRISNHSHIIKHKEEKKKKKTQPVNLINKINFYDRFYYIVSFDQIDQFFFLLLCFAFLLKIDSFLFWFSLCCPSFLPFFQLSLFPFFLVYCCSCFLLYPNSLTDIFLLKMIAETSVYCNFEAMNCQQSNRWANSKTKLEKQNWQCAQHEMANHDT